MSTVFIEAQEAGGGKYSGYVGRIMETLPTGETVEVEGIPKLGDIHFAHGKPWGICCAIQTYNRSKGVSDIKAEYQKSSSGPSYFRHFTILRSDSPFACPKHRSDTRFCPHCGWSNKRVAKRSHRGLFWVVAGYVLVVLGALLKGCLYLSFQK